MSEKQEPVAIDNQDLTIAYMSGFHDGKKKREWVELTDEEIFETHIQVDSMQYLTFGKALEAKLKEKNT